MGPPLPSTCLHLEQEHSNFLVGSTKSQWPGGASDGSEGGDNMLSCQVISAIFIGDGGSCLIHELAEDCCRKQGDSTGGKGLGSSAGRPAAFCAALAGVSSISVTST